jgi:hypothetical protein
LPKLKVNSKNFSKSSRSAVPSPRERAKAFALDALLYLANDEEEMGRFLAETGFDPADLRKIANDPGFAGAWPSPARKPSIPPRSRMRASISPSTFRAIFKRGLIDRRRA